MEFLVIEKVATEAGIPNELFEQVPGILSALKDYQADLQKRGKLVAAWGLADVPGGVTVLNVSSAEELTTILGASPSTAFPLTREVHPVGEANANFTAVIKTVEQGIAQRHAMMANHSR